MTDPSRVLVLYYSRTGTTRAVAQAIRSELRCDLERIDDRTRRTGWLGLLRCVVDSLFDRPAQLLPIKSSLRDYDLVIIGGPVWNGGIATPIRTFLDRHRRELGKVAFFCTYAGTGSASALRQMAKRAHQEPVVTLDVRSADARSFAVAPKIRTFASALGVLGGVGRKPCTPTQKVQVADQAA